MTSSPPLAKRRDGGCAFERNTFDLEPARRDVRFRYAAPGFRATTVQSPHRAERPTSVVGGSGRIKLDYEVVELSKWTSVRSPRNRARRSKAALYGLS